MPLTLPLSEQIDLSILAAVERVTTGNGFQITLSNVVRWDPDNPPAPADLLAIVSFEVDEPAADKDTPHDETPIGHEQWNRHYSINVYLAKLPDDQTGWPTWRNIVTAEIQKAVATDRTRGGLAGVIDTYIHGPRPFQDANDATGITIDVEVRYRTAENDPYTAG